MKMLVLALLMLPSLSWAAVPELVSRQAYQDWLAEIGSAVSPYTDSIFDWYDEQLAGRPLPPEVMSDPDHLFVSVERPLRECIRIEDSGEVEKGVTYGLETYGLIDAPIQLALETILFRWGKPVGAESGVTYPFDTLFGYRKEQLAPEYGPGSYKTFTDKARGGLAKDMHDSFTLLARGNEREGYVLFGGFLAPTGRTSTTSFLTAIRLAPTADGKTEYRVAGFQTGQSYLFFGIENGRKSFGFNAAKIREGQKEFYNQVAELKRTGKISERKPGRLFR